MGQRAQVLFLTLIVVIVGALVITARRQQVQLRRAIAEAERRAQAPVPVRVVRPFRKELRETIRILGTVKAASDIPIASELVGRVVYVGVKEGDFVRAGQVLVRLDDAALRAQVRRAEAAYRQALARYRQLQLSAVIPKTQAETDVEKVLAQLEGLLARLRQMEVNRRLLSRETDLTVEQAEAAVSQAHAYVRQLERQLKLLEEELENRLLQAEAEKKTAELILKKLRKGARPQEKEQARQKLLAAEANLKLARLQWERAKKLYGEGAIAKADLDRARQGWENAEAAYRAAKAAYELVMEGAREEDIAIAEQRLRQAEAQWHLALAARKRREILKEQLEAARAQLRQAKVQLKKAKAARLKREAMDEELAALRAQMKQLQATLKLAKAGLARKEVTGAELAAAKAQVEGAKAVLENAKTMLQKTLIIAPSDGYITEKRVEVGSIVSPGLPLMRLTGVQKLEVEAPIGERELAKVREGQEVLLYFEAMPDRPVQGIVRKIVPVAQMVTHQFKVIVALPSLKGLIRPGSFVRGEIIVRRVPDALVVPPECLVEWGGKTTVFVVEEDHARKREVKVGMRTSRWVQILSGVTENDRVIRTGLERLSDETPVQVVEVE